MDLLNILYAVLSLGCLGLIFGILLGYASKKFEVQVDPKVPKVREVLPGANCGGCGYPGCDAYAEAVVSEGVSPSLCTVGGAKVSLKIGEILGREVKVMEKKTAFVKCSGDCDKRIKKADFRSATNCIEAKKILDETKEGCTYGCLGLASCVSVCKFDALHIVNGVAKVDYDKCVNCMACARICPMGLIESVQDKKRVRVACNSQDNGKTVRENCKAGCIGCKICEKNCEFDAVSVENNIAKVDYDKCTLCMKCTEKCPTKVIKKQI